LVYVSSSSKTPVFNACACASPAPRSINVQFFEAILNLESRVRGQKLFCSETLIRKWVVDELMVGGLWFNYTDLRLEDIYFWDVPDVKTLKYQTEAPTKHLNI